ncbi:non-muscle caldesmon isoform X2 [Pseudochaenichthys georgianus]|uniref:non-muscle caldesmon isoform X2 n=1 Tax=Pseudochaenichthys georgianus TaxID=52239 RepID=UPI00146D892E|nr:non-muscle caldesmon isoform X2 [Pseudochaenichthys georgianus]
MSNALLRSNSSKQGLKNLMKLTAQRSVEDAEELERERRRRARESYCWTDGGSMPGETSPEDGMPAEESMYDGALKPNSSPSLEEDEGFSDWTQRRERRRQQRLQELSQGGEEEEEEENRKNKSAAVKSVQTSVASSSRLQRQEHHHEDDDEEERVDMERRRKQEEEEFHRAERMRREKEEEEEKRKKKEVTIRRKAEVKQPKEVEKRKEVKISYTSKVFLNQEAKQSNGDATKEEVTTIKNQKAKRSTSRSGEEVEADQELTELKMKREERRRVREEEERRREEEERQKLAHEEITERTESLSRSLKKSNSFKKTQPLGLLIKIDDKREQYAHAVENSQEARAVKASLSDLPGSPEVVSSKKNLFEAGETWSPSRGASCKDTEGLKVGVANRITQWVKGPTDGSRTSLKPADVRPGEVMQKKNMWEIIGDSTGRPGQSAKGSAAGKKYKFVVTGHGKYEKIPVDEDGEEFADGEDDLYRDDY